MKQYFLILISLLNFAAMANGQTHEYVTTGKLQDYSQSKASHYIVYVDRMLKEGGDIDKLISSGDKSRATRMLNFLPNNIANITKADPDYPVEGFEAKIEFFREKINGPTASTTTKDEKQTTATVEKTKNNSATNNNGTYELGDYSKSPASGTIAYLDRLLKPNGQIESVLKSGDTRRANNLAKGTLSHIQTLKSTDPNFDAGIFENRLEVLTQQANSAHNDKIKSMNAVGDLQMELSKRSANVSRLIVDENRSYFNSQHENFVRNIKEIDWKNTKPKLEQALKQYPQWSYSFGKLTSFEAKFAEQQDAFLLDAIKQVLNKAAERAQISKIEALYEAERAYEIATACLEIIPNHSATQQIQAEAKATIKKYSPSYPNQFHEDHLGQILFSSQPITANASSEAGCSKTFKPGEHLYIMAYLKGTIGDYAYKGGIINITMKINGDYSASGRYFASKDEMGNVYFHTGILPKMNDYSNQVLPIDIAKKLSAVSNSNQEIMIEISAGGHDMAIGSFTLDASGGTEESKKMAEAYQAKAATTVFQAPSVRQDPTLEQSMLKAFAETGWVQIGLKATISNADWRTVTHVTEGHILYRAITGQVAAKDPDGKHMLYQLEFMQEYTGGGQYSSHTKVRHSINMKYMDVKNLNILKKGASF